MQTTLPGVVRASGITIIRVSGEDAVKFLHGQMSQAIEGLGDRTVLAGYCSPKGRLLAVMRAWMDGADVMLALPRPIVEGFLKRIRMYVLRAKVVFTPLEPAPQAVLFLGAAGEAAAASLGLTLPAPGERKSENGWTLLGLPAAQAIEGFSAGGSRTLAIAPEGTALPFEPADDAWRAASSIAAGVPQVLPETREKFVPQHVNLELVGGVSFRKGCYPGQEVISRVEHIGETNRRAAVGRIAVAEAPLPGAPVYAKGEESGSVVLAAKIGDEALVLYSATLDAIEAGVSLTPDGAVLTREPLPYRYRNVLKEPE
ncbi:folate-binding protein YgfZ [Sutterella sp.]|uniref:CAF17-like 4Fe-4S cluster assembly/insertion protein YgfZ n=1 Tax=Sutterella sp. TaxID=1981025 RepID=UPI0026DFD04E|nr:folate-binding protein [Sutterella sp.]MDO5532692.1 folate-binding protein [Sutterella sp.]